MIETVESIEKQVYLDYLKAHNLPIIEPLKVPDYDYDPVLELLSPPQCILKNPVDLESLRIGSDKINPNEWWSMGFTLEELSNNSAYSSCYSRSTSSLENDSSSNATPVVSQKSSRETSRTPKHKVNFEIDYKTSIRDVISWINTLRYTKSEIIGLLISLFASNGPEVKTFGDHIFLRSGGEKPSHYYKYKINRECKGFLLKYENRRLIIVVVPIKQLIPVTENVVNLVYTHSMVYEVIDGTTFYLYNTGKKWLASTANCFDMELDNTTYLLDKHVFKDCLKGLQETLFRELTYTFILRHPKIQPLVKEPVLYLQKVMSQGKVIETNVMGVPRVKPIIVSLNEINNMLHAPIDAKVNQKNRFGVILVNKKYGQEYLVKTKLYDFIDFYIYNHLHTSDIEENMTLGYKNSSSKSSLKILFPAYSSLFLSIDNLIEEIAENVCHHFYKEDVENWPEICFLLKEDLDLKKPIVDKKVIINLICTSKYGKFINRDSCK